MGLSLFSRWYIILTTPQAERKAASELRREGIRVYVPKRTRLVKNRKSGEEKRKARPLMAGYVLVRFPSAMLDRRGYPPFGIISACNGARDYLKWTGRSGERCPVPIPDLVVREFIARQRGREFDDEAIRKAIEEARRAANEAKWAGFRHAIKSGDPMRVTAGPFESFLATIVALDDKKGADILVDIFGRQTPVHVDEPGQMLEPVAKSQAAA